MATTAKNTRRACTNDKGIASAPRSPNDATRKKLLYVALCDPDLEVTGATVRIGAFVRHLSRYYDVTLVNMGGSGHAVEPWIDDCARHGQNRLGVVRRVHANFSRTGYFLFSSALCRAADSFLKNDHYNYLLTDYGLAAVYGVLLSRRHGVPLIYSSHNVEHRMYQELSGRDFRRKLLAPYVYWAERAACRMAHLVVTISDKDREHYARWIPRSRIEVIPQGFDPEATNPFYESPPAVPPVILFVGNFHSENNRAAARSIVRKIAPAVRQVRADAKFQLIGANPPPDFVGPNIECPGYVDDLAPYLRRANLVIAPLPFAHGMATKVILALAFGKTVLATPEAASGIPFATSRLVVASTDAFGTKILELLRAERSHDIGEFDALCNDFAWPNLIDRLARRIEERCGAEGRANTSEVSSW